MNLEQLLKDIYTTARDNGDKQTHALALGSWLLLEQWQALSTDHIEDSALYHEVLALINNAKGVE